MKAFHEHLASKWYNRYRASSAYIHNQFKTAIKYNIVAKGIR